MGRIKQLSIISFVLILLIVPTVSTAPRDEVENEKANIQTKIYWGFYCDAEGDGKENDIITWFSLKIRVTDWLNHGGSNGNNGNNHNGINHVSAYSFNMTLGLELPSGRQFNYEYTVTVTNINGNKIHMHLMPIFWDHALESGWYTFSVKIELTQGTYNSSLSEIVFDPPEEDTGTLPPPPTIIGL